MLEHCGWKLRHITPPPPERNNIPKQRICEQYVLASECVAKISKNFAEAIVIKGSSRQRFFLSFSVAMIVEVHSRPAELSDVRPFHTLSSAFFLLPICFAADAYWLLRARTPWL